MILYTSLTEGPPEVLVRSCLKGPCELADAMSELCLYESSCGRLVGGSCNKIL